MTNNQFMISFLQSYLDFAADTTNNPYCFTTNEGICEALYDYYISTRVEIIEDFYISLHNQLMEELKVRIKDSAFPFGFDDYMIRMEKYTQHECPKRLAFVKAYLSELKGVQFE